MQQVRIGFIGCGNIARRHVSCLEKMEQARLVAFCDVQKERAEELAAGSSGRAYSDYREMLDKEKLEAVYVCTPPFARQNQENLAAEKGLHLFIEKPVALNMEKALNNQKALEKAGVIVSVGYVLRYLEAARKMKELLAGRKPNLATAWYLGGLPNLPWFGEVGKSGGQILDQTSHLIDMLGYLLGEVETVSAEYGYEVFSEKGGLDIADSGTVSLRFKDGTLGSIINSCALGFRGPTPGMRLMGEGFFIEFTYNSLHIKTAEESREEPVELMTGYEAENRAFLETVLTGKREKILCPFADGLKTLSIVLAANRSAEEGQRVSVEEMFIG